MVKPSLVIAFEHKPVTSRQLQPGVHLPVKKEKRLFVVQLPFVDLCFLFEGESRISPDIAFGDTFDPYIGVGGKCDQNHHCGWQQSDFHV